MENLLKVVSFLMVFLLIVTQLLLNSPYRANLTDDSINGRTIKTYETLLYEGTVMLDSLGDYKPNSASILINGEPYKTIDKFPIELTVFDGDLVEVRLKLGSPLFYVFLASMKGEVIPDMKESTVLINPGFNKVFKALVKTE